LNLLRKLFDTLIFTDDENEFRKANETLDDEYDGILRKLWKEIKPYYNRTFGEYENAYFRRMEHFSANTWNYRHNLN
jgi:hypothetical protein